MYEGICFLSLEEETMRNLYYEKVQEETSHDRDPKKEAAREA